MEDILSLDIDWIVSDEVENVRVSTIRPSEKNNHFFSDVIETATENDQKALQVQHSETRLDIGVQSPS